MGRKTSRESLNQRLHDARMQHHWSQKEVADRIGTTTNNVSRWELGQTMPGPYFRARLCALFGKSAEELGLVQQASPSSIVSEGAGEETEPARPSHTEALSLWTVPYARNPHFTGRDNLFDQLTQHFSSQATSDPTTLRRAALTQTQAIKGLGGIGKTQIAVEYAYRAREQGHYRHIFWVNATSEEAVMTSLVMLTELLPDFSAKNEGDQRKLVAAIKHWLEQCQQRWLLIFDNADDLPLLQEYLPHQGNGSILLTTRANAVGSLAASIEVENMGLAEGTVFLLRRAQRQHAHDEERNEATNIVIALDGFPLALDQAGAYIEETGCNFAEYLQLYQDHRNALLARRGLQSTNYPDSVATTWSLSFQKVEQANPAAAELLRLCAFLAPDHIPEELLNEGMPYWPPALQHATADPFTLNHLLEELLKFSLIKRRVENRTLSIHRLVQAVQMDAMEPEEQRQWAKRVIQATNVLFPEQVEPTTWPRCQRSLSQAQVCRVWIQSYAFMFAEAASLLFRSASYLQHFALYEQAEPLFQQALHIQEQLLGSEHPDIAASLNGLAELYSAQGKYEQAESLFQRVIYIQERTLGFEHPEVAHQFSELAKLCFRQGKYKQAESLFQRALHIQERKLGTEHPDVATSLNGLAVLYAVQEQYEQAEPLYERALSIWEQKFGPEHPHVARPLNNLAILFFQQEKYEQAEMLYKRVLHIWEQSMGLEHPNVAHPLHNLAELYAAQGRYEQAEPLYERALHIWEQAFGPEHFHVAFPLHGLAKMYSSQKKYKQAELLYERALCIREQALEPNHLDIAETLYDFAALRQAQGNLREASSLYQRALAIREQVFGLHHPKTAETRERLCAVLPAMGKTEQAATPQAARQDEAKLKQTS